MVLKKALIAILALSAAAAQNPPGSTQSQQQRDKQQRDLTIEKERARPTGTPAATEKAPAPAARPTIPRSYALVIGVSAYAHLTAAEQLKFTERDADAIYSILISPEGGNFRAENVHKLVGTRATLANIRRELETWLPSVAKPDDRVVIYFAGHGFILGGRGYLAPYDFVKEKPTETGYPMDSLGQVIGSKIQAKWKVLMTDACHSGAITPETRPELVSKALLSLDTSLFSLTASRDRELSLESEDFGGGHGLFTYFVVKGLEGSADESGDGIVTADELAEYVRRNVREESKGRQNPTSERGSFDPNMLLAFNPSGSAPELPPAQFGTLVFEANMDDIELFVDNASAGVLKKGTPFRLQGLKPGPHSIKGVKMGYEPDGPREEMVYPGTETTVTIRILIVRRRTKAAADFYDKGLEYYERGGAENYQKAALQFQKAIEIDPKYTESMLYLGRSLDALYEFDKAAAIYKKAIDLDPDFTDARASYGGTLLNTGDTDEAIRQFNVVLRRKPDHLQTLYQLAEAYRYKEAYTESIDAARQAIRIKPKIAEPHLWLAESLRMSGKSDAAVPEYQEYLRLSNFDSGMAGALHYNLLGYTLGMGRKRRAAQKDIWKEMRSIAYFGLCDADRLRKRYDSAVENCTRALTYSSDEPLTHYALAQAYAGKYETTGGVEFAAAAATHFRRMLALSPEIAEAPAARKMLALCGQAIGQARP